MLHLLEQLRDEVREFDPDVLISLDSRCGLWAEMLFDWLQKRVPVIVGCRFRSDPVLYNGNFPGFSSMSTDRGTVLIPNIIERLRNNRILLVNDYSRAAKEEVSFIRLASDALGFLPLTLRR